MVDLIPEGHQTNHSNSFVENQVLCLFHQRQWPIRIVNIGTVVTTSLLILYTKPLNINMNYRGQSDHRVLGRQSMIWRWCGNLLVIAGMDRS